MRCTGTKGNGEPPVVGETERTSLQKRKHGKGNKIKDGLFRGPSTSRDGFYRPSTPEKTFARIFSRSEKIDLV